MHRARKAVSESDSSEAGVRHGSAVPESFSGRVIIIRELVHNDPDKKIMGS